MKPKDKADSSDKNQGKKFTPHRMDVSRPLPKNRADRNVSGGKDSLPEDHVSGQFQKWGL